MFRHLLVPTDFSATSQRALEFALELALGHSARLTLLHISEDFTAQSLVDADSMETVSDLIAFDTKRLELSVWDKLSELLQRPVPDGLAPLVATRVVSGQPAQRILEAADELVVDAIIMGTHGRRGFVDQLMGSTAERVLKGANCSVLVIKPEGFPLKRD
jgi:universal stress protein A